MLHPTGRKGHAIGPNGVRYKNVQHRHMRRGRYVVRRRSGVVHMSAAAAVAGARR